MARNTEENRVKKWFERIHAANKTYEKWSDRYGTEQLEEYYLGKQWKGTAESEAAKLYVINMVYATMEVNKPSLVFYRPQIKIEPRPGRGDDLGSKGQERAKLCQDTVQTFIDDPDIDFQAETALALHEAHFRFGVIEVGYTSDFVDNPNAGKPILKEDKETPVKDSKGYDVMEPASKIESEELYIKRIPSKSFRAPMSSHNILHRNDWVAYYEWHYVEDLKKNPEYENTAGLKATGVISEELRQDERIDADELEEKHGMIKIWKIWDIRKSCKYVVAEGHKKFLIDAKEFKFLPFSVMKFHEVLDSFYPMPPVFQWLGPQDEVNETREMQRAHRRRFYRRYTYQDGMIDTDELEKLETGGDGVYAKANGPNPIMPVPDAPLSADVWQHLDESKTDFLGVSGISGDQRGIAESETATQANIIDVRSRIREASARTRVADWLAGISRLMLMTIRESMALPFWIHRNVDPIAEQEAQQSKMMLMIQQQITAMTGMAPPAPPIPPTEGERVAQLWQEIQAQDLGESDVEVAVDLASMSPVTEEAQRNSWNQVLALITNPAILALMANSEVILRKTLRLYGITSETEIKEIQRVCQEIIQMQAQAQAMEQEAAVKDEAGAAGVAPELVAESGSNAPPGPNSGIPQGMEGMVQ